MTAPSGRTAVKSTELVTRHATSLELCFDLVVVVAGGGIAVTAGGLPAAVSVAIAAAAAAWLALVVLERVSGP